MRDGVGRRWLFRVRTWRAAHHSSSRVCEKQRSQDWRRELQEEPGADEDEICCDSHIFWTRETKRRQRRHVPGHCDARARNGPNEKPAIEALAVKHHHPQTATGVAKLPCIEIVYEYTRWIREEYDPEGNGRHYHDLRIHPDENFNEPFTPDLFFRTTEVFHSEVFGTTADKQTRDRQTHPRTDTTSPMAGKPWPASPPRAPGAGSTHHTVESVKFDEQCRHKHRTTLYSLLWLWQCGGYYSPRPRTGPSVTGTVPVPVSVRCRCRSFTVESLLLGPTSVGFLRL